MAKTWSGKRTQRLAKLEGENNHYATWVYRYQLLKARVIRHLPEDCFQTILWIMFAVSDRGADSWGVRVLPRVADRQRHLPHPLRPAQCLLPPALHQDVRQIAGTGTSDLMARFTNDTEQVGVGLKVLFGKMVGEPLKVSPVSPRPA